MTTRPLGRHATCASGARRFKSRGIFRFVNSCSQTRITVQPFARRRRFTLRSRVLFPFNFAAQNAARFFGQVACLGHPCQKQPSTNTAIFIFGNTKSGLPGSFEPRLQPVIPVSRNMSMRRSSVSLFPVPRIRDITSDRLAFVNTSGTVKRRLDSQYDKPHRCFLMRCGTDCGVCPSAWRSKHFLV